MCETKAVTSGLYLDMNEGLPDVSGYEKELEKLKKDIDIQDDRFTELAAYNIYRVTIITS